MKWLHMLSQVKELSSSEKRSIDEIRVGGCTKSLVTSLERNRGSSTGEILEKSGEVGLKLLQCSILERGAVRFIGDRV